MYKILKNIDFKMSGIDIKLNMKKIVKFTNIKTQPAKTDWVLFVLAASYVPGPSPAKYFRHYKA